MRQVLYHRNAVKYLRRMPVDRKEQVKSAITELAAIADISLHPNVKAMAGEWSGCLRLRIGQYRAIFRIAVDGGNESIEVLQVGLRGNIY